MKRGSFLCVIFAGVLVCMITPAQAARWTLVDFGTNETTSVTPYSDWTQILRHPNRTQFVQPDSNPAHDGITITAGLTAEQPGYFGIRGTTPIDLRPGHEIICTFYNRADYSAYPAVRISFTDADVPDMEEPQYAWYTIYNADININTEWVPPYSLVELRYYIQDEAMLAAMDGIVSTGRHSIVNVNFAYYDQDEPALVLTKIEFSDEADLTPPTQPEHVRAECISLSAGASQNAVKLTWSPSTDPGSHASGVSRYYIYRNNELYDLLSPEMAVYQGTNLQYIDLCAAPGSTNSYAVAALDKAQYGLYPRFPHVDRHPANRSVLSESIMVTTPVWSSSTLLNPSSDFAYEGGFRLPIIPDTYDWSYASAGLAWYPGGNPASDPDTELAGSLYAMSHTQLGVGSLSIPKPVLSANINDLPCARTLIPVNTNIWPRIYADGRDFPDGGGDFKVGGIAYHPGGNGVTERLYYGICNFYGTDADAPSHGWMDLGLEAGHGAWHLGGEPPSNICPSITARYMCPIPQDWADTYTDGRSLLTGNNFLSGGPELRNGPTIYAIAPWASGSLPTNGAALPATLLLQYSDITSISNQVINWRIDRYAEGAVWLEAGGKAALIVSYRRPMGDSWYGDEAGNNVTFYNIPEPPSGGEGAGATRFRQEFMLYNPADLEAVVRGEMRPWEPQPYMCYDVSQFSYVTNNPNPQSGAICYATNGYLFFMEPNGDVDEMRGENALIHAWRVDVTEPPGITILSLAENQVNLGVLTADNGCYYYLQHSSNLSVNLWNEQGVPVVGDGTIKTCTVAFADAAASYYRCEVRSSTNAPTPTPTPTSIPTLTPTPDPTPTPTPGATPTPLPTPTPVPTPTPTPGPSSYVLIDHTCRDAAQIPSNWVAAVKQNIKLHYAHTSHGSQPRTGAEVMEIQDAVYQANFGYITLPDETNALCVYDGNGYVDDQYIGPEMYWLDEEGRDHTLSVLSANPTLNVSIWFWCGQLSEMTDVEVSNYLAQISWLEQQKPAVQFVYTTGHLDGTDAAGVLHQNNELIRAYCQANNKVLYDFADIERYDPDGVDYLNRGGGQSGADGYSDGCLYITGNWADEWCAANPGSPLCATCEECECIHSQPLNCNLKGRAFWWMLARIAGWPGL